jgi:serine/threonine protein kinase
LPSSDQHVDRYQFLGEIARGGMGAVLKGRDTDLGRDLAVKVLLEKHRDNPGLLRRFVEEAQIGGQLQHPGIVPVYELGCFDDRRPFFTMKLVKGHTLAALLEARRDLIHDRPRFLAIFETVCQTMAYAHARGVIHRDLKPHNVMVGSFGEVQVMDWGLAKVLRTASLVDERTPEHQRETLVETARSSSETYASHAGAIMGTPGYMPPEQASGEVESVDERADVFALGAILCEILTGHPPYSGRSLAEVHRKAKAGDLSDALDRLAACGAEAELLELARRCLARRAPDRHRDARDVAQAMTTYLAGVQDRLRTTELARVEAQARTEEERKRRKTQLRMAAAILLALALGTAGVAFQWNRAERHLRTAESRFGLAREAIERFYTGASEDVLLKEPQFKELREKLLGSSLEFYKKLQASLEVESGGSPRPELAAAYESVGKITGEIGSVPTAIEALQRAIEIRRKLAAEDRLSSETQATLANVLEKQAEYISSVGRVDESLKVVQEAGAIRQWISDREPNVVRRSMDLAENAVQLGTVLGSRLGRLQDGIEATERAISIYGSLPREAKASPAALRGMGDAQFARCTLLHMMGRAAESFEPINSAVAAYEQLARLAPDDLPMRERLGRALMNSGTVAVDINKLEAAGQSFRRALANYEGLVHDRPNNTRFKFDLGLAHHSLAWWLGRVGRNADGLDEYRRAIEVFERLARDHPSVAEYACRQGNSLTNRADLLRAMGRLDEALLTMKQSKLVIDKVLQSDPDVPAYQSMSADVAINIAAVLYEMGRNAEAKAAYQQALVQHDRLTNKTVIDQFNIACLHGRVAAFVAAEPDGSTPARRAEVTHHLDQAMAALFATVEAGYRQHSKFAKDPDLDLLRSRPDFQQLLMDLAFPDNPFAK